MDVTAEAIHEIPAAAVWDALRSRPDGLADREIDERRRTYGRNRLAPTARLRWARCLSRQCFNFFSILLDVAAGACFVATRLQPDEGMVVLGWALLAVSLLNSLFAFAQEMRAERAMDELRKFLPQMVQVRRAGRDQELFAEDLVPGDLVLLAEGDRIPADARLVRSEELLINNAPLTGEARSQPVTSTAARGRLIDSPNIAFAGCSVLRGSGAAVVFATGHRTQFGKIALLSRDVRRPLSPLQREINRMVRVLTVVAMVLGLLFFAYGAATGRSLWVNIVFMLGIIVANVPEGLLPTFTLALAMASLRMARKNVLIKTLDSVEALGAVHAIGTDKTGTLTRNELAIAAIVDGVRGESLSDPGEIRSVLTAALIASQVRRSNLTVGNSQPRRTATRAHWTGDPLDVAVTQRFAQLLESPDDVLSETRRHFPFDLQRRREAGVWAHQDQIQFAVKGAWESLRPLIGFIAGPGGAQPATAELLDACDTTMHRLAQRGHRVIAVARRRLDRLPDANAPEEALEQSLVLAGFLAVDDPIRPEAPAAVQRCHHAGIRVLMITGDHPDTAASVARQCGILPTDQPIEQLVLLGSDIEMLSERQLVERLRSGITVFARTTPEQKLKIVTALQRLGYVVGMTGDGVNDAPALKAADVGIAMGVGGTDVAREAADIVLLDDNFASIVAGVDEGRAVFANMQKFTTYVLASNIPEIVPFLVSIVFRVPLGLTVIQILSIDLGTDLLPAIGLGQELPEPDLMARPPRRPKERLLSFSLMATAYLFLGMIQAAWSLFLFALVLVMGGWRWGEELSAADPLYRSATGITLTTIVLMQIGNVIGRRSSRGSGLNAALFRNKLILLGIATEIAFSWGVLYWAPIQRVLRTGPVEWPYYALAWLGVPLFIVLDWWRKRCGSAHIAEQVAALRQNAS